MKTQQCRETAAQQAMPILRKARRDGQSSPARAAVRGCRRLAGWVAVVAAVVTLVTFAAIGPSQACPNKYNLPQVSTRIDNAQSLTTQSPSYKAAQPSAATPWSVGSAERSCCGASPGHCHSPAGTGSCCPACTAAIIASGWSISHNLSPHIVVAPLRASLASTGADGQFRPPRSPL